VQVFPFERNLPLRTDEETLIHAREAVENNQPVYGVKGPSALALLTKSYIRSTAIDSMHLIGNIVKLLNSLWFDSKFHDKPFSLSRHVRTVDKRLKELTPPSYIERMPRTFSEHGQYWNISERKLWLFMYSLIVLRDLMVREYFDHHKLLVTGLYMLHQSSISELALQESVSLLTEYVCRFEDLYGRKYMTMTIHSLLHLGKVVEDLGPLFTTSCFPLEGLIGVLKYFVHGTRFADSQIVNSASMFQKWKTLQQKILVPGSKVETFCTHMSERSLRLRCHRVSESTSIVGVAIRLGQIPDLIEEGFDRAGIEIDERQNVFLFQRLLYNKTLYCSEVYNISMKTKSFCVKYRVNARDHIGLIQCFVKISNCNCQRLCECASKIYALVKKCATSYPFVTDAPRLTMSSIHQIVPGNVEAVSVDAFEMLCFFIRISETHTAFAVEPPNRIEKE